MGRFSLARKLATSLLAAFLVGALAVTTVRLRPEPSADGPAESTSSPASTFDRMELAVFDALAKREATTGAVSPEIALVTVDEESVKRCSSTVGGWPWPRELLGTLVGELRALGARLVVLDASFSDASRLPGDDARFVQALEAAKGVVGGFTFGDAPEEDRLEPGRWAVLQGSYATRGAALLAVGPLLASDARLYLVPSGERIEVWIGGFRDRASAQQQADHLRELLRLGSKDLSILRELKAEETLDRVTVEALFAERNAVTYNGGGAHELNTFQNLQAPVAELVASAATFGNLRLGRDQDGTVRGVRHLWRYDGRLFPSLALAAAMALQEHREVSLEGKRLRLGHLSVPIDAGGLTRLRFWGRGERKGAFESPYPVIPALGIVRSAQRRAEGKRLDSALAERLRGKVVFVAFELAQCERAPTPIANSSLRAAVWATALDNLLRSEGLLRATADEDAAVAFAMALLGALVSLFLTRGMWPWRSALLQMVAALVVGTAFVGWALRAYRGGLWIALVVPLIAFIAALASSTAAILADERMAITHIREALGRHIVPGLIEQLLRRPHHLVLAGERRALTALACNLRGFAAASSTLDPKALVPLFDDYLATVCEAVAAHRGQIDRVAETAVVAYWGAPLPNAHHALDACRCALRLKEKLAEQTSGWREKLGVELAVQIGVATGDLVVGNLKGAGARARPRFAVFGPTMEAAERLAAEGETFGASALVGEVAFEGARDEMAARELDLLRVPSRARPLRALELLGLRSHQSEAERSFVGRFEQALIAFRRREFQAALEGFEALAREAPADAPSALYVDRCRLYLEQPPGAEWDGVFELPAG